MRVAKRLLLLLVGIFLVVCMAVAQEAEEGLAGDAVDRGEVTVFGAASTGGALRDIAAAYESVTGVRVRLSLAASSTLARQIDAGARADVYISANEQWMDMLVRHDLVVPGTRRTLLTNHLVVVAPHGQAFTVEMVPGFDFAGAFKGRLALGDPAHVPAGMYAKEALEYLGWWDAVKDRLVPAANVRAALRFVELGEVNAGIVYLSDAQSSPRVDLVAEFPDSTHTPIQYPAAICKGAAPTALPFYRFLFGERSANIFRSYGFAVVDSTGDRK